MEIVNVLKSGEKRKTMQGITIKPCEELVKIIRRAADEKIK